MNSLDYILGFVIANKETELHNYLNECIEYIKANITNFFFELRNENNKTQVIASYFLSLVLPVLHTYT